MIQDIGINITATGAQTVASEFNQIATSMQKFQTSVTQFSTSMKSLSGRMETLFTKASKLNDVGAHFSSFANRASTAISGLSSEMGKLGASIKAIETATRTSGSGGSTTGSGGMFGGLLGGAMGPFGFMARFMAFHQAIRAGQYAIKDIALGGSREELAKAGLELSAVNANQNQKAQIEKAAHEFAQKYPMTTAPEFMKSASQVASALDINQLGAGQITRMTQADIIGAKLSKMQVERFSENMSKIENSFLSTLPIEMSKALKGGKTVNIPGYGMTDMATFHEKNVAKMAKLVEVTNIWGQGAMDFMSYAGSVGFGKGMSMDSLLAHAGALADAGYKGAKSGRAFKDMMVGREDAIAKILDLGEGKYKMNMSKKERDALEDQQRARYAEINQMMSSEEGTKQLYQKMMPGMAMAIAASKDPNYGLSLLKDIGLSKEFIPQFMSTLTEGFQEQLNRLTDALKNANFQDAANKANDAMKDAGWQIQRLSNTWSGFVSSLTTAVYRVLGDVAESSGLTSALNQGKKKLDEWNNKNKFQEDVSKLDQRPSGATGDYSNATGEQIMGAGGVSQMKDAVNKMMAEEFKNRLGEITKPGADASEDDKKSYKEKVDALRDEIRQKGLKAWEEHWRPKEQYYVDEEGNTQSGYSQEYRFPTDAGQPNRLYEDYRGLVNKTDEAFTQNSIFPTISKKAGELWEWFKKGNGWEDNPFDAFKQEMPQDSFLSRPPLTPEPQASNIEVKPNIKVVVELDGRELKSTMRAMLTEENFYNRMNVGGEGLFTS